MIVSLLLAFVADGARDAPALAAAECAAIAVSVVLARGPNHVNDVFNRLDVEGGRAAAN